jgi:Holliday junction resolvase RusA-like endonuclease
MIASQAGRFMKAAAAKKCRRLAKEAIEAEEVQTLPWEYVIVHANFYHSTKRRRDEDNYQGMLKAAYDGLVDAGLVADDDSKHMSKQPPRFLLDKDYPRVELFIERLK